MGQQYRRAHKRTPLVNRDTEAGRKLFLLYGGHEVGRAAGAMFSTVNRRRTHAHPPAPLPPAAAKPPPRPKISVPRFGGGGSSVGLAAAAAAATADGLPRRRPGAAILSELRAAADTALRSRPPPAPVLGDAEKERLALMMQHRGQPPAAVKPAAGQPDRPDDDGADCCSPGRAAARSAAAPGSKAAALQARFDDLDRQVQERQAWLEAMQRDGLLRGRSQQGAVIRLEVAERAAEMAKIDAILRRCGTSNVHRL
jgi:hypothetical protein